MEKEPSGQPNLDKAGGKHGALMASVVAVVYLQVNPLGLECSMVVVFHLSPPPDFLDWFPTVWKKSGIIQRKGRVECQLPSSYV